jgi:hypothetical protein
MTGDRYRYSIRSLRASSARYGSCEVCREDVTDVHRQTEEREYQPDEWTCHGCRDLFGHRECLEARRRQPHEIIAYTR